MDVHRCRFVPYQPSAINAIAFSQPRARSSKHTALARLAIGRANGDIEIWNPSSGIWHQELIIRGGKDRSIDGLVWVNEPDQDLGQGRVLVGKSRLFSIGYSSAVTEWDLEKGKPKRHASGQHGDIWCFAAQPQPSAADKLQTNGAAPEPQASNKLIAGTVDGELVIYSIEDDDLRFQRVLVRSPTKKAQMVSITFQSRKVAIVGCSDSTIRAYDITKGHLLRRMTLGSDLVGGAKDIIVWSVQCLPNGNIVSGDSTGQLCIWDGKTFTQMQRIQSHKQDVLSLATSLDGTAILSGGMDRRTVLYKQNPGSGQRWSKVWSRRYHDHDVKAMASFESGRISVVVSGGPDSNPVIVPLKEMGRENHRTISTLPQQPPITSAHKARFIVSWWEREVHLWILRKPAGELFDSGVENSDINENRKLLKTIVIKGDANIASATIDPAGTLLVVSTAIDVKAFRLEHEDPSKPSDVKLFSAELPQKLTKLGASHVQLSPDKRWLCTIQEGARVLVAAIDAAADGADVTFLPQNIYKLPRLRHHLPRYVKNGGMGSYDRTITHVAFSADSKMLATADLAGHIDSWVLQSRENLPQNGEEADLSSIEESDSSEDEEEDEADSTTKEHWARNPNGKLLPKLPSAPVVLSFSEEVPGDSSGNNDYTLLVVTSNWNLVAFRPLQGSLTQWSRRNTRKSLPPPILDLLDLAKGAVWQGQRVWIYGVSFLIMIDMSQDLPKLTQEPDAPAEQAGLKRKRKGHHTGAGGKMKLGNLRPHQIHKHGEGEDEDVIMEEGEPEADSNSDEDDDDADGPADELAQLRNASHGVTGGMDLAVNGAHRKSWWMTYKYRPIFGIVSLGDDIEAAEVALVERPTWNVDMAARYFSGAEWER